MTDPRTPASDSPPEDWGLHPEGFTDADWEEWEAEQDNGEYPEEEAW